MNVHKFNITFGLNTRMSSKLYRVLRNLTVLLNKWHSSGVIESALAITGIIFTLSCNLFMNSTSIGFKLQEKKKSHYLAPYKAL